MASSKDVRDIMGFAAPAGVLPANKKKAGKPAGIKKPTGMSREVAALHGDRPPPVAIVDSGKLFRKAFTRDKFKPSRWEHVEFNNDARDDGLHLRHWRKQQVKGQPKENNGDSMEVDGQDDVKPVMTPYEFAKFNVQVTVPTYTDEQYEKHLQSDDWSREETDYLLDLVKEYYQKWPIIVDRYEWQSPTASIEEPTAVEKASEVKPRDLEALKCRYYSICAKHMEYSLSHGVADMNAEEFALHEQYARFNPQQERLRKTLAWTLCRRTADEVKEEEQLLAELQRIMISAQKFESERAELRQRLEIVSTPAGKDRQLDMSSTNLHNLWQQLVTLDRSRKPRARISIDGSLQSPAAGGGLQTPASAGGHRDSVSGPQKKGSISQQAPLRQLSVRDERRFGVSAPTERIVSGVTFRTDKLLKLRQAKSQIQTQKINQALTALEIPELIALPTTRVVQAFESLVQKINLLLDARKGLAKEEHELQTAKTIKAEVEKKKAEESGDVQSGEADAEGSEDAEGEADADADGDGEDIEMADAPAETQESEEATRPSSSRSNTTRNKRSASILSAASSKASRLTRSHKYTDRDYSNDGEPHQEHVPKFFAKAGFVDTDPKKIKKEGGGKGNWGLPGTEVDSSEYNMTNPRRRSNSSGHARSGKDFKSKFEVIEHEPVFEDMPPEDEDEEFSHIQLEQQSTTSSTESQSIEEEHN